MKIFVILPNLSELDCDSADYDEDYDLSGIAAYQPSDRPWESMFGLGAVSDG
ncbi:MAG: hypothetical protein HQK58_07300 [Deltaproteobacteria bacterium]|nr:hypothetical protein [Deltaproteobacteria bacterium]